MKYLITWRIDVEADSPEEAAREALTIQRNPTSTATFFEVTPEFSTMPIEVDLG